MQEKTPFDFWYAVNNTEVLVLPKQHLETFGTTILNYHLITELMDSVNQVRIREGKVQASQPQIITPQAYAEPDMDGFSDEARKFVDWTRDNEDNIPILKYGFTLKQESFSEHVVCDSLETVADRVKKDVKTKDNPLSAVAVGVDDPWDVCLLKVIFEVVQGSFNANTQQLASRNLLHNSGGIPPAVRVEIDSAFLAASRDKSKINDLGSLLQRRGAFQQYEDRFFALVNASKQ